MARDTGNADGLKRKPRNEAIGLSNLQDHLSKEDFRKVADARRSIWTGGFTGMAGGAISGLAGYIVARRFQPWMKLRKHGLAMGLGGAMVGAFVLAVVRGRPAVAGMDTVYDDSKRKAMSGYQRRVADAAAEERRLRLEEAEREHTGGAAGASATPSVGRSTGASGSGTGGDGGLNMSDRYGGGVPGGYESGMREGEGEDKGGRDAGAGARLSGFEVRSRGEGGWSSGR